eukprot:gene651-577_t
MRSFLAILFPTIAFGMNTKARMSSSLLLEDSPVKKQSYGLELVNGNNVMYTAWVGIGTPRQDAKMIFDTGSSHFWVNSDFCKSDVCVNKNQFFMDKSSSFLQRTDKRSRDVTYGAGYVRMLYGTDKVWFGDQQLPTPEMIGLAYDMDPDAFRELPNDGIIGLGPISGLSMSERPESLLSFFKETQALPRNIFTVYLSPGNPGSKESKGWIEFGDVPTRYMANPDAELSWVPIVRGGRWWEMRLFDVYVGAQSTGYCRRHRCSAVADTGSTDIAVPMEDYRMLQKHIRTRRDCSQTGDIPPLTFVFETTNGKTARLTIPGSQFIMSYESQITHTTHCETYLRPLPAAFAARSTYVLGMPFLRQYLSVYDFENDRVGFTEASHEDHDQAPTPKAEKALPFFEALSKMALF